MTKTYTFFVHGMHCASCVVLTEGELKNAPGVERAKATLSTLTVEVTGDFGEKSPEEIARTLTPFVSSYGYTLSTQPQKKKVNWSDFSTALPIAAAFVGVFILLQKLGIVNLVTSSEVGYSTAFLIGLIASVSTCMAVVGGLVLSMSANFAKSGATTRPQLYFHVSRIVSFFILGGVIGALGATFQLGSTGTLVLGIIVGLVLLILGINLLDVFPKARALQLTLPGSLGRRITSLKQANRSITPVLLGALTFFLPCGFTQSMQLYALSTGSFATGALTMFFFALGTFPVLALLSFSSLRLSEKSWSGIFFKAAGLIVIFFALANILGSLAGFGIIPPIFSF